MHGVITLLSDLITIVIVPVYFAGVNLVRRNKLSRFLLKRPLQLLSRLVRARRQRIPVARRPVTWVTARERYPAKCMSKQDQERAPRLSRWAATAASMYSRRMNATCSHVEGTIYMIFLECADAHLVTLK